MVSLWFQFGFDAVFLINEGFMSIISIANSKGGTGKSSVAINLIHHMHFDIIIDADTTHHALSSLLALSDHQYDIRIPTCPEDIINWCDTDKNVLIDCGGFDSVFAQYAISQSDFTLTPTNDDPTEQIGLTKFSEVMKKASEMVDTHLVAKVLITKVHPSRTNFSMIEDYVNSLPHLEVFPLIIPFSAQIPKAQYEGKGVQSGTIAAKFSKMAKIIQECL